MESLFLLLAVILGYGLGIYQKRGKDLANDLIKLKEGIKNRKQWGDPFVIEPDEGSVEKEEQIKKEEQENDIFGIIKNGNNNQK